jgi:hypothetical protein
VSIHDTSIVESRDTSERELGERQSPQPRGETESRVPQWGARSDDRREREFKKQYKAVVGNVTFSWLGG